MGNYGSFLLDHAAYLNERERWEEYALDTEYRIKDLQLRLEEIIDPEKTEQWIALEELTLKAMSAGEIWAELNAKLVNSLRNKSQEERNVLLGQLAKEHGQKFADDLLKATREEPSPQWTGSLMGQRPKLRSDFPPPTRDEARGIILLKIIAALWAQSPFPNAICQDGDLIKRQEPPAKITLTELSSVREWLSAAERITHAMYELQKAQVTVDRLLDAAAQNYYGESLGTIGHPKRWTEQQSTIQKLWKSLYPAAMTAFKELLPLKVELAGQLSAWESNRPSLVYRVSLICGLIGGWTTFLVGVIVPLCVTNPPRLLYLYLPLAFYFLILSSVMIFGVRETRQY